MNPVQWPTRMKSVGLLVHVLGGHIARPEHGVVGTRESCEQASWVTTRARAGWWSGSPALALRLRGLTRECPADVERL
jgi:hypothetical protein